MNHSEIVCALGLDSQRSNKSADIKRSLKIHPGVVHVSRSDVSSSAPDQGLDDLKIILRELRSYQPVCSLQTTGVLSTSHRGFAVCQNSI